jgi:eukaryotic-like serine/threonine-protein kinase
MVDFGAMCPAKHTSVQFGMYEVDLDEATLRKAGVRIKVQQQPFKVLQALLENPGELVSREQLHDRIWPDTSYGDFDQAVNVAVAKLRTALGDSADNPRFIETVPRRGYRFVAPVSAEASPMEPVRSESLSSVEVRQTLVPPEVPRSVLSRRAVVLAGVALVGGVLIAGAFLIFYPGGPTFAFHRVTYGKGSIRSARFGPDGHSVIYGASWSGTPSQVFWAPLQSPEARAYALPNADILAVSAKSELAILLNRRATVGWMSHGTLATMLMAGGAPREVAENVQDADWDPEGKKLAIIHWAGQTSELQFPLGHVAYRATGGRWLSHVRVSPRGDLLAFLEHPLQGDDAGYVEVLDLSGQKKVLSQFWFSVRGLAWDPSGNSLWFSASDLQGERERPRAIYRISLSGKLQRVASESGDLTLHDVSRDGALLISRDVERYEILANESGAVRDLSWLNFSRADDLSADGQRVVLTVEGEAAGSNYEVYLRKIDGSPPVKLGEGYGSAISPDGNWVLAIAPFDTANAAPQMVLWPVGQGTKRTLTQDSIAHYDGGWFPDGNHIVFIGSNPDHSVRTWMQDVNGSAPQPITPEGITGTHISPDGKFLCAVDENDAIWIYPIAGGAAEKLNAEAGETPVGWSQSGREVYVARSERLPVKIYRIDRLTGKREIIRALAPADSSGVIPDISSSYVSANGATAVYSYFRLQSDLYTATTK